MRQLNQFDIDLLNKRLTNSGVILSFQYGGLVSLHELDRYSSYSSPYYSGKEISLYNFVVEGYNFSYSVSEKTLLRFDNILNKMINRGFSFNTSSQSQSTMSGYGIVQKNLEIKDIEPILKCSESSHNIHGVKYKRREFSFNTKLINIIYYVTCVQDAVDIIQKYYEYTEDGVEICKVPYSVGSLVTFIPDPGVDYFVQSIDFETEGIFYTISKIETNYTEVLIFSETITVTESELSPNRDDRINSILKKE